jgi:hypothetical protein
MAEQAGESPRPARPKTIDALFQKGYDVMTSAQPIASEYSVCDKLESVTLVDAENNAIGSCGKIAAHRAGKLHRAFSILIANQDGEVVYIVTPAPAGY